MVLEYRAIWDQGGSNPGYSVFHARGAGSSTAGEASQDLANKVRELMDGLKAVVTVDYTFTFPPEVLDFNTSTGELEAVHTIDAPANVVGTSANPYSAASGARIEWRTSAIVEGRRLRGRTYIVPVGTNQYEADGTLTAGCRGILQAAADSYFDDAFTSDAHPSVWSRTHGIMADISAAVIPDEVSVLRSRRD